MKTGKITVDNVGFLLYTALTGTEEQKEEATRLLALLYSFSRKSKQIKTPKIKNIKI